MRTLIIALTLTVSPLAAGPAAASATQDVWAVVHQFEAGFNEGGGMRTALAACAAETVIIDAIPPYEWHGSGACARWLSDYDAYIEANHITHTVATLRKPRHIDITADRAYLIAPATLQYDMKGKRMKESGATFTAALARGPSGWRITGWSYSEGR